ncbi:MAG TPA: hypothetical protein VK543_03800 [Puia sp.]|nr:hypothetical protein [Puia sp.]
MKKISTEATRIFCRLLDKLKRHEHIKLAAEGFMPLTVERLEGDILTPYGTGTLYSIAHYYFQNGDIMSDPQMVFIVVDNRKDENDFAAVGIFPQMYQQDNLGLYEESAQIESGKLTTYNKLWQPGHCRFANLWLRNIKQQGFLK